MTHKAKTAIDPIASEEAEIVGIKGYDANLKCRKFQFEIGKTYTHTGPVVACESGFHAITGHPFDVFNYYPPASSRYTEVTQSRNIARHSGDSKVASAVITIGVELSVSDLVTRAVKWVFDRANWKDGPVATEPNEGVAASGTHGAATASGNRGAATASGDQGAATASGNRGAATASGTHGAATASGTQGAATASGDWSVATASGNRGAATASGYRGAATASGNQGAATASGNQGAATASGNQGAVQGKKGNALFLVYHDPNNGDIMHAWAGIVGRDGIKPMVFYRLDSNGNPKVVL